MTPAADRPLEGKPITESCWICGAPVVRTRGADNGLRGAEKIASADTLTYSPPSSPVENSELRERERRRFVQGFIEGAEWCRGRKMFDLRNIRNPAGLYAEERFATLTDTIDVAAEWKRTADAFASDIVGYLAEISRLRADQLTPEEAGYTVTLLENRKRSFEVTGRPVSETVLGAIAKLSRISEERNPK